MSLQRMSFPSGPQAAFFELCHELGLAREEQRREFWTIADWRGWVALGRAAFGPGPNALWGQLSLVEGMLKRDATPEQIANEMAVRKRQVEAEDRRQREAQERADVLHRERARRLAIDAEREKEVIKETAKIQAREQVSGSKGRSWEPK